MTNHERLIRDLKLVKAHSGLTDDLKGKIDSLYVFGELTDDEFIEITAESEEQ